MIIGTAGHIDHGKTLLVSKLTGVDTDRLKEEKTRGISIELGFAYVPVPDSATSDQPDGDVLGFVDVPGHEKFVHTMVAGATGIDFALLVVAADDGVMPQTKEHLQVLDILGIEDGVVALNKIDIVDEKRLSQAESQIADLLVGTSLEGSEVLRVSAATGEGLDVLKQRLLEEAASRPQRPVRGNFRMAIDRSFTLQGAGTVVTGAIRSGSISEGDSVVVLPLGKDVRVRSLHVQGRERQTGSAGERCALNLAGIKKDGLKRGDWLVEPGTPSGTERFDAELQVLASEERAVRTWSSVQLHVGTSRVPARVVILEGDRVKPGDTATVQIVLERPLPIVFSDQFVLRDVSAGRTIGGGHVIDPGASRRRRRTDRSRAIRRALRTKDAAEALDALLSLPPGLVDFGAFVAGRGLSESEIDDVLDLLEIETHVVNGSEYVAQEDVIAVLDEKVCRCLEEFHRDNPDLPGMPLTKVRQSVEPRLDAFAFEAAIAILSKNGAVVTEANCLRLPSHTSSIRAADRALWDRVVSVLEARRHHPPPLSELVEELKHPISEVRKICKTMTRLGALVEVRKDRYFLKSSLIEFGELAHAISAERNDDGFTVADFRDRAGCGRAIAVQVLEYFDRRGVTGRRGDVRVVGKSPTDALGEVPII